MFNAFNRKDICYLPLRDDLLDNAWEKILRIGMEDALPTRHGQNMANCFRENGDADFTFLTTPGVEPTNNLAEQAIRLGSSIGTSRRARAASVAGVGASGSGRPERPGRCKVDRLMSI